MTGSASMREFAVAPETLRFVGSGLQRPECVLCTRSGTIAASRWPGGVSLIRPGGGRQDIVAESDEPIGTNGFAAMPDGSFLLANLHDDGGVWRLRRDGTAEPFLLEIDGRRLPPTNFVGRDAAGRVWITVSTWQAPRHLAYRPDVADGFVILVDPRGARIAADGLGYTNEAVVDPTGRWLYVNETFARRTSRLAIRDDGSLGPRETVAEYGPGTFPDGLAFDAEGAVWLTSVVSNRVIRVEPDGDWHIVLEESDTEHLAWVEEAYQGRTMGREHLDSIDTEVMKSVSSIAFGGPDLKDVYLGNLLDERIYMFRSPVAGHPPAHWELAL